MSCLDKIKFSFTVMGAILSYAVGGFTVGIKALVMLMVIDWLSGLAAAYCLKKVSSEVGMIGIIKKTLIMMTLCVANIFDYAMNTNVLRDTVTCFYIANEGISIIENVANAGVPVPEAIRKALSQIKDRKENKNGLE